MTRNADPSGTNRDRLVIAAAELVDEVGYLGATIKAICKRAGLAVGTFYVHFSGKPDLFEQAAPLAVRLELTAQDLAERTALEQKIEQFFGSDLTVTSSLQEAARYDAELGASEGGRVEAIREQLARSVRDARHGNGRPSTHQQAAATAWLVMALVGDAVRERTSLRWPVAPTLAGAIWLLVHDLPELG